MEASETGGAVERRARERGADVDARLVESQRRLKDAIDASRASRAFANDLAREMSVCEAKLMRGLDERRELRDELESARKEVASLTRALERSGGSNAVANVRMETQAGRTDLGLALSKDTRGGGGEMHQQKQQHGHERVRQLSSLSAMALLSPIALAKSPSKNLGLQLGPSNAGVDVQRVFSALASSRWWYKATLILVR